MRFWKTRRAAMTPQISTPLPALTSLRRLRLGGPFCGARSGENAGHGVVAFVAGIFVDGLVALAHRNNSGERPQTGSNHSDRPQLSAKTVKGMRNPG